MVTAEQQQVFRQLGMNPDFLKWLADEIAAQDKVLRKNPDLHQLHRAQGAVAVLDEIKALCERKQP